MGRLIDADRLKAHYCWWAGGSKEMSIDEAKKIFDTIIDVQPTVEQPQTNATENMVEIVRCKDCENWVENEHCLAWAYEYSDADGYCYLGKRREDGGTVTYYANDKPVETIVIDERKEDE